MYTMTKEDGTKVEVFLSRGQGELVEVQTSAFIEKIFEAKGGPVGAMSMDEFRSYTEGEVVSYEFDWDTVIDVNTAVVFGVVEDVSSFKDMSWLRVLVPGLTANIVQFFLLRAVMAILFTKLMNQG